jgi:uncharacterized phage protein (TIGR02216 family)
MAVGLGVLGLAPQTFWGMTWQELTAAIHGHLGKMPEALSRGDLSALMRRFPDAR